MVQLLSYPAKKIWARQSRRDRRAESEKLLKRLKDVLKRVCFRQCQAPYNCIGKRGLVIAMLQ